MTSSSIFAGYADRLAHEFSDPADWRGRRVHILGGSPPKQLDAIRQLTDRHSPTSHPADIVGVDWNGLHRGAQFGEFWTADGWDDSGRDADHVTVRKTVRHSLARVREFWRTHGIWPETTPQDEGSTSSTKGRVLPISNTPPVPSAGRTSGELAAARTSPNTIPAQSVDTAATSATSSHRHRNNHGGNRRRAERLHPAGVTSRPVFRAPEGGGSFVSLRPEVIP